LMEVGVVTGADVMGGRGAGWGGMGVGGGG